jgi:tetratricopeptide (TPR) repeat protein
VGRFSNLEWKEPDPPRDARRAAEPAAEPRDEAHWLRVADEQHRAARFEKALRYYSRALELNPNLQAGWVGQVRMLLELGENEEARLWAEKGLDVHRDDPELLAARAVACARLGDPDKALAFCDAAMKAPGATTFAWLARGEALLAARRGPSAAHCFEKARVEAKGDWFASALVARTYTLYGVPAQGLVWAQRAVEKASDRALAWLTAGDAQAALGLAAAAEGSYRQAHAIDPDLPQVSAALDRLARKNGFERFIDWARGAIRRWRAR